MKLYEYIGKKIFNENGIKTPRSLLITSKEDIPDKLFFPCVLKSQVLVSGRMKAGGILFADSKEKFIDKLDILLTKEIRGEEASGVLVEEKIEIDKEYYISLLIDRQIRDFSLIYSKTGGIDIEDNHDNLIKGSFDHVIDKLPGPVQKLAHKIKKLLKENDLTLLEINPFGIDEKGEIIALDAVLHLDDNAIFRQKWAKKYQKEEDYPFHYVRLDGDIGIIGCGAGIVMATMDAVNYAGGTPANFLDIGGGAEEETTLEALNLLKSQNLKKIVLNIFGGITRCDEIARALVNFKNSNPEISLFIRLTGTNETEGRKILSESKIKSYDDMYQMIREAVGQEVNTSD